jgi:hypothetical protein
MLAQCQQEPSALDEQSRARFVELLPRLQDQIEFRFRRLKPELREELSAEATALAFDMFVRLVGRKQADRASASSLAMFACRQVAAGRRCGCSLNVRDITSPYCQKRKGVRQQPFHFRCEGKNHWEELVVEDRHASPADVAIVRIDFRDWLATLSRKKRRIAETLAGGDSTSEVAGKYRMTAARISQIRRELLDAWHAFQGIVVPDAA